MNGAGDRNCRQAQSAPSQEPNLSHHVLPSAATGAHRMSFIQFMSEVRASGSPLGYFAKALDTHRLPEPQNWEDLQNYLVGRDADPVAIRSAAVYWRDYEASRDENADALARPLSNTIT
jgi:hypothetical protein